ncbi:virulence factor SrfC family protein [Acerihabitans sp. KWT182]|uniref:Virulence factor SrfC family protein n=1 Tax=Acerihabitans sp. KWT182 TaxID=3157919 RepID=A0AAU7QF74_9GAMM
MHHLRNLPQDQGLLDLLGVEKATLTLLAEELIVASARLDIAGQLCARLQEMPAPALARESRADRQVAKALTVLGDFIAWLGFQQAGDAKRPDSRINPGHKIFARPEKQAVSWNNSRRLTKLAPTPANTAAFYIYDWLVGLREMIIQNQGFAGDGELTEEQQARLASILNGMNDLR